MKNKKLAIFGALAISGIVLTAVTTAWGTAKAVRKIDEVKPESKKEAAKLVWKYYIPAGLSIGLTIISDVCFYRIGLKEIAVLTSSVTYLTANRDKLEKKLKETVGEEKFNEAKEQIRNELVTEFAPKKTEHKRFPAEETGYGDTLFLDGWSGRFFRSNLNEVLDGIRKFNDSYNTDLPFSSENHISCSPVSWNDFFDYMHIVETHQGYQYGYPANEDFVEPGTILIDPENGVTKVSEDEVLTNYRDIGEDIYVIEPSVYPMLSWQEL